jgi:3-methylcrotonyl-CoA carboxylase alpha subunit
MQGDEVSIYYDPMIAKLIVWDENRDRALSRLAKALSEYRIAGLTTNIPFLYNLATAKPFKDAALDTSFITQHADLLFHVTDNDSADQWALPSLLLLAKRALAQRTDQKSPWAANNGWRLNAGNCYQLSISVGGHSVQVEVDDQSTQDQLRYTLNAEGRVAEISGHLEGDSLYADLNGHRRRIAVADLGDHFVMYTGNQAIDFREIAPDTGADEGDHHGGFSAPMNGKVIAVLVEPGANVEKDQTLVIMEAMKMEHSLRAPSQGVINELYFAEGELVSGGDELLSFTAEASV